MKRSKPRILSYSHDTYGLGHLRRTLAIAGQIAEDLPNVHQLLLTGSMVAGAFGLPPRLDMVKLPALSKRSNGQYTARALPFSLKETLAWREQMIMQAVVAFKPDVVLVDKSPAGVQGELLPALRYLKTWSPDTRLVLGMRDIEDDPEVTLAEWAAAEVPRLHAEVYDHILYYGQRHVFDPVAAYDMSARAAAKLVECGYLGRPLVEATRSAGLIRRELGVGDIPLVVVTVGGGGDGHDVIHTYLDMLAGWHGEAPFYSLIVTGPLMAHNKRQFLRQAVKTNHLTMLDFTPDLFSYLAAADVIVGMAGYNTTCEVLALGQRAILVPRVRPRGEQRLRAERLAEHGLIRMLLPGSLTPEALALELESALAAPRPTVGLNMNGLAHASTAIANILNYSPDVEPWPLTAAVAPRPSVEAIPA